MKQAMNVRTVGQLREVLSEAPDDAPIQAQAVLAPDGTTCIMSMQVDALSSALVGGSNGPAQVFLTLRHLPPPV